MVNLRILVAEDNPLDAELVVRQLIKSGFDPKWRRVDTAHEFRQALSAAPPDVIISDHAMPQFSSVEALNCVKEQGLRIPFIVVSHAIGEEEAVLLMRNGAADYLMKDRLGRLGESIRQALDQQRLYEAHADSQRAIVALNADLERRIAQRTEELQRTNRLLEGELESRRQVEAALQALNAELEERVEQRTRDLMTSHAQLRALATELNLAEQRERKRLATELHDHMAQLLALGKLHLAQSRRWTESIPACHEYLTKADEVLTEALTYARTLVHDLSPSVLHEFGLGAALTWLGERMRRHGLAVTVDLQRLDDPGLAENRAVLLFQCVRELLMNVVKHAKADQAEVRAVTEPAQLTIEVQDEGRGFDSPQAMGSGASTQFGLFSIRERMAALGGSFEIESSLGKGTTARLVLPRNMEEGAEPTVPTGQEAIGPTSPGKTDPAPLRASAVPSKAETTRVLLVDDHAMMRQGLRSVLEAYADVEIVGEAGDGEEALASVERLRPSVVIMDINMPKMNGIDATKRIKQRYPETLVLGLSVNAGPENQSAMAQAGASALLTKEAAVDQLYSMIQQMLPQKDR